VTDKQRQRRSRFNQGVSVYIAIVVTVLAWGVWESVGTNNDQNGKLAVQAKSLAEFNHRLALEGCQRGNYVRGKINVIGGVLVSLLHKSVEESEKQGHPLTPAQESFLEEKFEELSPLNKLNCKGRLAQSPSLPK
jgi:hypothetical protein